MKLAKRSICGESSRISAGTLLGVLPGRMTSSGAMKNTVSSSTKTTPEATTVHAALAAMRDHGMEYAVIESSSHGLSPRTNRLGDVEFDVGVMTNVTHEHLEFHGTWEQYRTDKANLFRALDRHGHAKRLGGKPAAVPSFGVANADDPSSAYFAAATARPTKTFSAAGPAAGPPACESFSVR